MRNEFAQDGAGQQVAALIDSVPPTGIGGLGHRFLRTHLRSRVWRPVPANRSLRFKDVGRWSCSRQTRRHGTTNSNMSKTKVFVCKKLQRGELLVKMIQRSNANVAVVGCQRSVLGPVASIELPGSHGVV
jgi:hypothetical protein